MFHPFRLTVAFGILLTAPDVGMAQSSNDLQSDLQRLQAQRSVIRKQQTRTLGIVDNAAQPKKPAAAAVTVKRTPAQPAAPAATTAAKPAATTAAKPAATTAAAPAAKQTPVAAATPTATPTAVAATQPAAQPVTRAYSADITVAQPVNFEYDSARLTPQARKALKYYCQLIAADEPDATYVIIGHTDASGPAAYNMRLSLARAEESRRYMISECGISASRIRAAGEGEERLLDPAHPRASKNRRVELQLAS